MTRPVVLVIQARMTSSRLPGKVLRPLLGRPMLARQVDRLRRCRTVGEIIVATTNLATDDAVESLCRTEGIGCFRGDELDVLARFHGAVETTKAQVVVRSTADCPLIDPAIVDACVEAFELGERLDYLSNCLVRTYPRGMDAEVFTSAALDEAFREAADLSEREHVTPFIYRRPDRYRIGHHTRATDESKYRLTVDTPEDFALVEAIQRLLGESDPAMPLASVLELLRARPDLAEINGHVEQKAH